MKELDFTVAMTASFVGVCGTLFGTILGWFLNVWSQTGDINLYVRCWEDSLEHKLNDKRIKSSSWNETEEFNFRFTIDLYNDSQHMKVMRKVMVVFKQDGVFKFGTSVCDLHSRTDYGESCYGYKRFDLLNIQPKTVMQYTLFGDVFHEDFNFNKLKRCNSIWLTYEDGQGNENSMLLCNKYFNKYFEIEDDEY